MRIGLVIPAFPLTSETFVYDQVRELRALGHEVDVISLWKADNDIDPVGTSYVSPHGRLSKESLTYALRGLGTVVLRPALWKPWARLTRLLGVRVGLPLIFAGYFAGKKQDWDILLCHFGGVGLWGDVLRRSFWPDLPQATIFHGIDLSASVRKFGVDLYRAMFRPGHLSIPIASTWLPVLSILGDPQAHYLRLGIDPALFRFRERAYPSDRAIRIISVGRLVQKKGQELVLRAIAAQPDVTRWHYDIVGDGPQSEELQALARTLGIESQVTFHGRKSHADCQALLDVADVFALPSQTAPNGDMEGVPVALMEAMAAGLPVVSSRHSGIVDLIEDGLSGLLVREGDVAGVTNALGRLGAEPELWARVTKNARATVEERYDLKKNTAILAEELAAHVAQAKA